MDGRDFIILAGKLAASPAGDEATYRTAISRAYYGAFHVARSFLLELGFVPVGNISVHGFVRHYLTASGNADALLAATQLSRLQTERNRADYKLDDATVGARAFAMVSVERAHRIVSAIENCRADNVRESIHDAIAEYEQKIRR